MAAILPQAGQQTYAFFGTDALQVDEIANILWKPPFTAINGWSEQPAEIVMSYIVAAKVTRASERHHFQYRYDFEVISCEPMFPKLRTVRGDWTLEEYLDTLQNRTCFLWEEASWCGSADVDGLKYICAHTSTESHMELLVEEIDGDMFGLLSTHIDPGGEYCYLGRRKFSKHEETAVRKAIDQAAQLVDTYKKYLID
ncbi:hypothetical protein [Massilia sp. YIM B04103]|uniref:hypothetical protein n=1 Tax=Massilia sp. YIM B04103 TaxID=2963106 RepID=UPI00210B95E9|nr:hypothetical protein [Massilia sp. YIM B04103]